MTQPTTRPEPGPARGRGLARLGLGTGLAGARAAPFSHDLVAGTVVAAMLVPQAMAYAVLAGVPPVAGLYAAVASLLVYGLVGPSRSLSVGPVAIDSLLTAQAVTGLALLGTAAAQGLAAALALLVAGVYLLFWVLRLAVLAALLSAPMLAGFTHAAALVIAFSQVKHLAGIVVPDQGAPWEVIAGTFARLGGAQPATLALGLGAVLTLVFWKRLAGRCLAGALGTGAAAAVARCAPLVAVLLATAAVVLLDLGEHGVALVGAVPAGLPGLALPRAEASVWWALTPTAVAVAAVGFLELLSIARTLAARRAEVVRPDAELLALSLSNAAAGLVGGFPVTGGLSRSMVNHQAGAASGRASLVTAALLLLALGVLTGTLAPIPRAALAAVVVVAVAALIDVAALRRAFAVDWLEGLVAVGTFAAVLLLGVAPGMALGVGLALGAFLVRLPGGPGTAWRTLRAAPGPADLLVVLPTAAAGVRRLAARGPLHLAQAQALEVRLLAELSAVMPPTRLELDLGAAGWVDATACEALLRVQRAAAARGSPLTIVGARGAVGRLLSWPTFADTERGSA